MVWMFMVYMKVKIFVFEVIKVDQGYFDYFLGYGEDEYVVISEDLVYKKLGLMILQMYFDDDEELFFLFFMGDLILIILCVN